MAEITAALIKELREKTGAGMMECKKALTETTGDMEAAIDWLRKKGLSVAAKKAGRVAAQGLVAVKTSGKKGAVVEVNIETDFAAKNPDFRAYVASVVDTVLNDGDIEAKRAELTDLIAKIGENMSLRRTASLSVDKIPRKELMCDYGLLVRPGRVWGRGDRHGRKIFVFKIGYLPPMWL